ncbi:hypothetical protein V1512DRAFT_259889 [Lipomyces arxii]|uniref:uncharacterized protein n=1 Tax=Lipomyces arxii TaxID=56418 RepID=UPI0034CD8045
MIAVGTAITLASFEGNLAMASTILGVVSTASKFFNKMRASRMRNPQRKDINLSNAIAFYFVRSVEMIKMPNNLERPPMSSFPTDATEPPRRRRRDFFSLSRKASPNWWQRKHVVNVLSATDNLLYTFERVKPGVWLLYSYPDRYLLCTIRFRVLSVFGPQARGHVLEFANDIGRRKIRFKRTAFDVYNVFYCADGAPYHWARATRKLERVLNYGGKNNEVRQSIAVAKPLRRNHLTYELLVDKTLIDPVVAIATAFVSMKTQWRTNDCPVASNKTRLPNSN